jgi:hypothetical protein
MITQLTNATTLNTSIEQDSQKALNLCKTPSTLSKIDHQVLTPKPNPLNITKALINKAHNKPIERRLTLNTRSQTTTATTTTITITIKHSRSNFHAN